MHMNMSWNGYLFNGYLFSTCMFHFFIRSTVKPVLSGHSKIDKTKVLKTNGKPRDVNKRSQILAW